MSEFPCILCSQHVRPLQHAVECDVCGRWQHRTYNTGITQETYREAVRNSRSLEFVCQTCTQTTEPDGMEVEYEESFVPSWESTRLSFPAPIHHEQSSLHLEPVPLPNVLEESSLLEETVQLLNNDVTEEVPTFTIIQEGATRGKPLLVEAPGFSYTVRKETKTTRFWWCSKRNKGDRCSASISETNGNFKKGKCNHSHTSDPGCLVNRQMTTEVKKDASENIFKSAMAMVEERLVALTDVANVQPPRQIARKANRFRQKQRPEDPTTMDFEVNMTHIPEGFLQQDITVDGARHLVFSTLNQLEILSKAKTWYVDGTFQVLRRAYIFEQLFGIHGFVRKDDFTKQVPLVLVFMTRRRKRDYRKVFKKLKDILPSPPRLKAVMLDFEAAVWSAIRSTFEGVQLHGCAFHWTQCVWKKVQERGLAADYTAGGSVQKMVRRLLALPLLPAQHIEPAFLQIQDKVKDNHKMMEVCKYIHSTWLEETSTWKPEDWSVYGQPIRTNNDCEGWHRRLNYRLSHPPPFYKLVDMLYAEAVFVSTQLKLVSAKKLKKIQKSSSSSMEAKVFTTWQNYSDGQLSVQTLLKKLSKLYGV